MNINSTSMYASEDIPDVYLHTGVCDMRLGIDGLSGKIKEELSRSVMSGGVFVFLSRCRRRVRLLYWDKDGFAMWTKRLEVGTFRTDGWCWIALADLRLDIRGSQSAPPTGADLSAAWDRASAKAAVRAGCWCG